ncbi:n-carbamoylsarcosine amidase [Thelonectria olida]|uniref:N-carbamoylsarcosine amidase n=1 Tax=Thelonectria olida TaxID=1576542 RepID=A0A9P8VWJ7_9HYPO|nr:n-carbamoylsarcosine amidase [Thelonectria olida]
MSSSSSHETSHPSQTQQSTPATTATKRRNPVACRRCRRLRSKCIHHVNKAPCDACNKAGPEVASECYFPRRGEKDVDRQFRSRPFAVPHAAPLREDTDGIPVTQSLDRTPREHTHTAPSIDRLRYQFSNGSAKIHQVLIPAPGFRIEDVLPPMDEVIEGCRIFVTSYFQLGFIPKAVFLEDLISNPSSISKFLLTCILSISARFTPSLAQRYGGPRHATDYFLDIAKALVPAEMYRPSLERIQAFFLLAICQWGNGDGDRSSMDMGVAVRMAALLKLHCEETYLLDESCPTEQVVRSESARRVFWMIQSQENLHSGYKTPAPFPLEDITTLLPCSEADFAFGVAPPERAALAGTPPALFNSPLVHSPTRCLFATLIQAHSLWGTVARRAGRTAFSVNKAPPWDNESDHQKTLLELRTWEENIPARHKFSVWNLRGWKSESLHLAYLSITMVLRLSNIVTCRIYLENMLSALLGQSRTREPCDKSPSGFWEQTSLYLFTNVWNLYEQIEAFFTTRAPDEGFPQILVFCVYINGSLATYLWRNPALCPSLADKAETMAQRSLEILTELHVAWPTSSKWQRGLQQIATPLTGVSPADEAVVRSPSVQAGHRNTTASHVDVALSLLDHSSSSQGAASSMDPSPPLVEGVEPDAPHPSLVETSSFAQFGSGILSTPTNDMFDVELDNFLRGGFHYDLMGNWGMPNTVSKLPSRRISLAKPATSSSISTPNMTSISDSYAASGYGTVMGWGKRPALLLIDVCKAYWTPGSPLDVTGHEPSAKTPQVMQSLLAAARENNIPVYWTAVEFTEPNMADAGLFWLKAKTLSVWHKDDTRGLNEWMDGLVPREGEPVIKKKYPSGFFGTTLQTELTIKGVDTVVICGVSTSGCVRATTLDALQYGFRPMVVGSACGDRSDEIHQGNLFDLNAKYADVVSEADALESFKKGWSWQ